MNDITKEEVKAAAKGYFKQVWSDVSDNSWKTNVTLGLIIFVLVLI